MRELFLIGLSYAVVFFSGFLLLSLLIKPAHRYKLVDTAGAHKEHLGVVPLIGGVSVFCSFVLGAFILQNQFGMTTFPTFMFCSLVVVLVGVLDDLHDISAGLRLLAQVFVGLIMFAAADNGIFNFGNVLGIGTIRFVDWALPVTVLAVLSAQNAMNMMDGVDGLSSGVALTSLLSLGYVAYQGDRVVDMHIVLLIVAALVPFMFFNLQIMGQNKRVFLGDAGSTFLGFVVVWHLISLSQGPDPAMRPVTALWLFAIPLMDMASIALRRILRGQSPFVADREHLHHLFERIGLSKAQTLSWILALNAFFAVIGLVSEKLQWSELVLFLLFLLIFCGYFYTLRHAWKASRFLRSHWQWHKRKTGR